LAKTYQLDTMVSPSSLLARAKKAAYADGATLLGDEHSGRFSHEMAKGEYRMVGQKVIVTVTDKHWLLPWAVVEAPAKRARTLASLSLVWKAARGPRGGGGSMGDQRVWCVCPQHIMSRHLM
jgi:hypothetical protein